MKAKILFKFATRSRPYKFLDGLKNINKMVADKENYKIVVSADEDDVSMNNYLIKTTIKEHIDSGKLEIFYGKSKSKIDAINRDLENQNDWNILINFSDDMEFIQYGFDDIIRQHFALHYPDFNGNLYYNDGYVRDRISTMSIIGKIYFDTILKKRIYNDEYTSLFCDDEYTEVAKILNKIKYYDLNIYKHNHPANDKNIKYDSQYIITEGFYNRDKEVYNRRKRNNFNL